MKHLIMLLIITSSLIGCIMEPDDVWPNHHIPYRTVGLNPGEEMILYACMVAWETASQQRVKFINLAVADDKDIKDDCKVLKVIKLPVPTKNTSLLAISTLGYYSSSSEKAIIFLDFNKGIALHELGHVLGLIDEIMRPDRAFYIKRIDGNPLPILFEIPFNKMGYKWYKYGFDYYSVMLYPGETGIEKIDGSPLPIQKSEDLSISLVDARIVFDIYSETRNQSYKAEGYDYNKD